MHKWTEEELAFAKHHTKRHIWRETAEAFEKRFGWKPSKNQIHNLRKYYGIRCEIRGAKKGHEAPNKGKSWNEQGISIETQERMRSTQFKCGNVPKQGMKFSVGAERKDREGYTWVKVCKSGRDDGANGSRKSLRCWRLKHHLVWEEAHGKPVPEGYRVIFANRDITDFAPENIVAVPAGILSTMNVLKLPYYDRESLESCMAVARIRCSVKRQRKAVKA